MEDQIESMDSNKDIQVVKYPESTSNILEIENKSQVSKSSTIFDINVGDDSCNSININNEPEMNYQISPRIRTSDVKPNTNASFDRFDIHPNILLALKEKGWLWPSPIQEKTIPKIISGKHILARSKNGTGKTGAYAIGVTSLIDKRTDSKVIILVPTRELALQTANVFISLAKHMYGIKVMVTTGGTNLAEDIYRLSRQVNIIVGTPGRIYDLVHCKEDILSNVEIVILDEADKLLSLDMQERVEKIINNLSKNCQKILFSATYPESLRSFMSEYLNDCEICNVMDELVLKGVTQYYVYLKENQKVSCIKVLMKNLEVQQGIIFCNSPKRVELLAKCITEIGFSTYYIHSKMNQESRNRVFHDFRSGFVTYLVCTDMMARGIDVPTVNVVFNFDFPRFSETFLHRVGRCGRFGQLGIVINMITEEDNNRFLEFEKELDTKVLPLPKTIDRRWYVSSYQTRSKFKEME